MKERLYIRQRLTGLKFPFGLDRVQNPAKPIFDVKPPPISVSESSCETGRVQIGHHTGPSRHTIIWTNAGILLIRTLGTNFNETLSKIRTFSLKKMHLKMSSGNWPPFCLGLNTLIGDVEGSVLCHRPGPSLVQTTDCCLTSPNCTIYCIWAFLLQKDRPPLSSLNQHIVSDYASDISRHIVSSTYGSAQVYNKNDYPYCITLLWSHLGCLC